MMGPLRFGKSLILRYHLTVMADTYDHKEIEAKWQDKWAKDGIYNTPDVVSGKENFYNLVEFSYPSGNLHVGHWYAFAVPDMYARFKRMNGFNVLYPTGFDAFGLPAENAAIKLGADPKVWTFQHMEKMRGQLRSMGAMFDWSREVVTCEPEYYKWTQQMFAKFFENDLAYRANTKVNWCPKDQTILANEQVVNGCCERCGTEVIQKDQDQWMLRITKYADRLVDDLEALPWPEYIKDAQRNWIGRTKGAEIDFKVPGNPDEHAIKVFTTRPETIFGATFVAVSAGLAKKWLDIGWLASDEIKNYVAETLKEQSVRDFKEKEKTGIFTGFNCINPATKEEIPVWITNYVMDGVGTGAIMAVPGHDFRDAGFARKFKLSTRGVIDPREKFNQFIFFDPKKDGQQIREEDYEKEKKEWSLFLNDPKDYMYYLGDGFLINSGQFSGMNSEEVKEKITEFVGGKMTTTYRLRDWGISRQRYWGVPIPIVYDPQGLAHAIPIEHLPWLLPTDVDYKPDGTAPLARSKELLERTEKIFGAGWKPEVETMDTFVDSSWYFYRYLDNKNSAEFASADKMKKWMPIDMYFGGAEHTTMHLLYSRFWTKVLFDLGMVVDAEPYTMRRNRGLILGPDGNKMSKSKGNVIDPDEVVKWVGADATRMYLAFMGPYGVTDNYPWDPNGVVGIRRFLERVLRAKDVIATTDNLDNIVHKTIKKVSEDIVNLKFNTAISTMMILQNAIDEEKSVSKENYETLLKLLAPFAPHLADELWEKLGNKTSIHLESWPMYDESKIKDDMMKIVIQINGKLRDEVDVAAETSEDEIKNLVLTREKVVEKIAGAEVKKVIYIENKLVNIVI